MNEADMVKVLVTTYNRRDWAEAAIKSALAQTYSNLHVVIVDDGSTDGTGDLVRAFAVQHPERVTAIVKSENRGITDSIRVGLTAEPEAPFVAFLNDDDLWYPDKLERQMEAFSGAQQPSLVYAEADIMDIANDRTGEVFSQIWGHFDSGSFRESLGGNHVCASTIVITGELARIVVRTLRGTLGGNWDYAVVMLAAGYGSITKVDEPLALYRVARTGISNRKTESWRGVTRAREAVIGYNPQLQMLLGGPRAARRVLALRAVDDAIWHLRSRRWLEYGWQALAAVRLRSPRAVVVLAIYTASTLVHTPAGR